MKGLSNLLKSAHRENVCWNPIRVPLPDGSFTPVPCKGRRSSVCLPCAKIFRKDWTEIFYSGLFDKDKNLMPGYDFYFLTFTAPSFGKVHRKTNCPCGFTHTEAEIKSGLLGVPLRITDEQDGLVPEDWENYDYTGLIQWQLNQSKLWQTVKERLRYSLPGAAWTAAREFQNRLTIHYHIIVRVPSGEHTPEYVASSLNALRHTKTRDGAFGFGQQFDIKKINNGEHVKYARYSAKVLNYSAKSLIQDKAEDASLVLHPARVVYEARLRVIAKTTPCLKRGGCDAGCRAGTHYNYGFSGRPATVSRDWSFQGLNRTVLKQKRRQYVIENGSSMANETYETLLLRAIYEDAKDNFRRPRPGGQIEKMVAAHYWAAVENPNEDVPIPIQV